MMSVDSREGSKHLAPMLQALGLPCRLKKLEYGDVCWRGNGPSGFVLVGVELKQVDDLVSSLLSKRLQAHQLPGLIRGYQSAWLLVQGEYRQAGSGLVQKRLHKPGFHGWADSHSALPWSALEGILLSFRMMAGLHVKHTRDDQESVNWLALAYSWWQKPWEQHQAHKAINQEQPIGFRDSWYDSNRYAAERVAALVPGIGLQRAGEVARHFGTPLEMALAPQRVWQEIKGIGPGTAQAAWKWFRTGRGA